MKTHFAQQNYWPYKYRDRTLCGLWYERKVTTVKVAKVTCKSCLRTLQGD